MVHNQDAAAVFSRDRLECFQQRIAFNFVEARRRLIQQQKVGLPGQRPGNFDPAFLTIECLDDDVHLPAPRLGAEELAARLGDAIAGVEHSVRNWNSYLNDHRSAGTDNVMATPHKVSKGLAAARYAFCFWNLAEDEALVLDEVDVRGRSPPWSSAQVRWSAM
mgnify:CR=1 FL=1